MTSADVTSFAKAMAWMAEALDVTLSDGRIEAYFDALGGCEVADVQEAVRICVRTMRFPRLPLPAELLDAIAEVREQRYALRLAEERRRYALPPSSAETDRLAREVLAEMRAQFPDRRPPHATTVISLEDAAAHRERARGAARLYRVAYGVEPTPQEDPAAC